MSINLDEGCACSYHRLLNFIKEGADDEAKSLLQKPEDACDATENSKPTLLQYAVQHNNTAMIQPLIDHGCNVNVQDTSGDTPLILAILKANGTAVDILLKNNADVYASNSLGENSLQMVCLKCYDFAPQNLIRSVEFNILKKVFEKANNDFLKDKNTTTRLVLNANNTVKLAVVANANVELAKIVLKNDYPLNFHESRRGFTALHVAIMFQNIENILLLIEHSADVDAQDYSQYSAIQCYLSDCQDVDENSEVLQKLLSRTAGLHLPNKARATNFECFLRFGNEKTVRAALQKTLQSDINICAIEFQRGKSLFHILIENHENADVYRILDELDIQCEVDAADVFGRTALTSAVRDGRVGAVEFLLKRGADVNLIKHDSPLLLETAHFLHSASPKVQENMPKITALLLEYGADAQYVFSHGNSLIRRLSYQRGGNILNPCDKMIVAHLALLKMIKDSSLTDLTRNDIESEPFLIDYFGFCTEQLKEMKNVEVHGNITLLKLLTKDQEQITAYARNLEFISAFINVIEQNSYLERYYLITLNSRVTRALEVSRFEKKLALIIENLTGICSDVYCIIIYKIINYLSFKDKKNLCNIGGMLFSKK